MTVLSDQEILARGYEIIDPFDPSKVHPASYDLALHSEIMVLRNPAAAADLRAHTLDLRTAAPQDFTYPVQMNRKGYSLRPGEGVLASSIERVTCPRDCVARVESNSRLRRIFLAVSGAVEPSHDGPVTLEIVNQSPWELLLWPRMPIAQISFSRLSGPAGRSYGSVGYHAV